MGMDCGPAPLNDTIEWGTKAACIVAEGVQNYAGDVCCRILRYEDIDGMRINHKNTNLVHICIGGEWAVIRTNDSREVMWEFKRRIMSEKPPRLLIQRNIEPNTDLGVGSV